jgi:hypothetical protein
MKNRLVRGPSGSLCARALRRSMLLLALSAGSQSATAAGSLTPDGVSITGGQGHSVAIYGVAAYWDSLCACADLKAHGFDTRLVVQAAYWHAQQHPTPNGSLWDAGLTPMLRWSTPDAGGVLGFVEAGIGVHLLSATRINNDRVFSTAFQFGESAGAGLAFGDRHRYELGVYVQHVSNARIKEPNDGLTYIGAVLRAAIP